LIRQEIDGLVYENTLDHEISIKNGDDILVFDANKEGRPVVKYEYIDIEGGITGRDKFPVGIENLPKKKKGTIYIVNSFILEALYHIDEKNRFFYESPGQQVRGANGKVLYADGMYKKMAVANKIKLLENEIVSLSLEL